MVRPRSSARAAEMGDGSIAVPREVGERLVHSTTRR
jgi:hypothetical protein